MKKIVLIIAGAVLMLTACHRAPVEKLEGNWITESLTASDESIEVVISNLELKETNWQQYSVNGNSGVNQFFGNASFKKGVFAAEEDGGSTKMMGSPEDQHFEDLFLTCLSDGDSYTLEGSFLTIEDSKDGIKITFKREEE